MDDTLASPPLPRPKPPLDSAAPDLRSRKLCCRGFTIIELMVVIAILATLASLGIAKYVDHLERARLMKALGDIGAIQAELIQYERSSGGLADSLADVGRENFLDPWQNPYEYLKIDCDLGAGKGKGGCQAPPGARTDQFLVPLNSDYDLYSKGEDAASMPPLTSAPSRDDIVRANDGGFVGLGSDY